MLQAVRMAQKVGPRLAECSLLQRPLPSKLITQSQDRRMQHTIRNATPNDFPAIAALLTAVFTHDKIPIVQTVEEVEEDFSGDSCRLDHDVMVVEVGSQIAGIAYTIFLPSETKEERCYVFGGVLPDFRKNGVGTALMTWAVKHGEQLLQSTGRTIPKFLRAHVSRLNESAAKLFAQFQLHPVRFEEDLIIDLDSIHAPQPAANYSIIPWSNSRNAEAHSVKDLAFRDHWGSTPTSDENWEILVTGSTARTEHSFFAVAPADKIIGLLLTHRYESDDELLGKKIGWIDKLCTLSEFRNQAVAKNLIAHALAKYKAIGLTHAALTVDTQNPTGAHGLYSKLGFEFFRGSTTFERQIPRAPN
ncbi:MAG: GNAT family N-acetyltransferase [Acidimicrobiia bacterium]|nr:GNAT family N-acetyltransferase [Acidimicrobiia bacterium]